MNPLMRNYSKNKFFRKISDMHKKEGTYNSIYNFEYRYFFQSRYFPELTFSSSRHFPRHQSIDPYLSSTHKEVTVALLLRTNCP